MWVLVENGRAAQRREIHLDLPLFLASNRLIYTGIALPMLVRGVEAVRNIGLRADGNLSSTQPLASMDKGMQTEFKEVYWSIVTRAMLSAMMKTTLQYQAEKEELGGAGLHCYCSLSGGPEDAMNFQARELREDDEFNRGSVADKGELLDPDLRLSGKIIQRNIRLDKKEQYPEYYFS